MNNTQLTTHALDPAIMNEGFQQYFKEEGKLVTAFMSGSILDVACGRARIVQYLSPTCKQYSGLDINLDLDKIREDHEKQDPWDYMPLSYYYHKDAREITSIFKENEFDNSCCLWNSLPIIGNESQTLADIAHVTKNNILITLVAKNEQSLAARIKYYEKTGMPFKVDKKNHIIYSDVWGASKGYDASIFEIWIKDSGIHLTDSGRIGLLGNYGIYTKG